MLLSKYKRKNRINVIELADQFGVSHQTMYNWIKGDYEITGRKGERVISLTRKIAVEGKGKV